MSGLGGIPFTELKSQLENLYKSCCTEHENRSILNLSDGAEKYLDGLINTIYKSKEIPDTDPNLIRAYGNKLGDAVIEGYGSSLNDLDWNTPDYHTLTALQNNVWQFSAAKTNTQLRDMGKALIGPDGKIRSFDDFKREAQQIVNDQLNWLRTEYDSAIGGAQMAAKWITIQQQKKTLPLLEFDAVIDDRTSTICRPLNKVVRPVDDAFWDQYYPPNHFNCRSTVRQLKNGDITPVDDNQYPEKVPDMFKVNLGKQNLIFPKDSAYYQDTPAHVINNATLYMPEKEQYITEYEAKDGTAVKVNRKTQIEQGPDYDDLIKVSKILADDGKPVDLLPVIHASETELRNTLLPGVADGKNPDMVVDGEYTEMKKPSDPVTHSKIQQLIAKAAKQANRVIVLLDEDYDVKDLEKTAMERFKLFPDLEEIGFVTADGEYLEFENKKK